ncbi:MULTISPECIES: hypothetical protein [Bacillaceae]|uniref:Uncharacterized protein n=1 Tax=Niallia hominis TaxID=3133173 RepID=A0ABV1EZ04_9BACI|nr:MULTISPECIES: hypothetical protein [Bacillaceae]
MAKNKDKNALVIFKTERKVCEMQLQQSIDGGDFIDRKKDLYKKRR